MAHYIYQLRLNQHYTQEENWTEETRKIVSEHFNYLKSHCEKGDVLLAGRTDLSIADVHNHGIVIFEMPSKEAAENFMNSDPAVIGGVMTARFFPFSLALLREIHPA